MKPATVIEKSANGKIAAPDESCSTTYACKVSCPAVCPFKETGACYGAIGNLAFQWRRLGGSRTPLVIAKAEAKAILALTGKNPLRIHTLGDCKTPAAAEVVAAAAEEYMRRHGQPAWTYTHAWRTVPRSAWGAVSVLASCETTTEVKQAKRRGYAALLVVPAYRDWRVYKENGIKLAPCPVTTEHAKSCISCGLCLDDKKLLSAGLTIVVAAHGPSKRVKDVLAKKAERERLME
jgi:hypothetical protein